MLAHTYGVLYVGMPLLAGESVRFFQRRRLDLPIFDLPIMAAALLGLSALAITVPMVRRSHTALFSEVNPRTLPISAPTVPRLAVDSASMFNDSPLVVLVLLALAGDRRRRQSRTEPCLSSRQGSFPEHETVTAMALSLIVLVSWTISRAISHYYFWRYGIGTCLGVAILTAWLAHKSPAPRRVAVLLLAGFSCLIALPLRSAFRPPLAPFSRAGLIEQGDKKLQVVVAGGLDYPLVFHYAGPALRERLHYIADRRLRDGLHDSIAEVTIVGFAERHALTEPLDQLQPFLDSNPRFLLYAGREVKPNEWLPGELRRRGYTFSVVATQTYFTYSPTGIYPDPVVLYLVAAPPTR